MEGADSILRHFWNNAEHQHGLRMAAMWKAWPRIVGAELAALAKPLGHNKTVLLLGVEDAVAMQEIHFQAPRILQAVNASLGEAFFDKVRFDLIGRRTSLDAVADILPDRHSVASRLPAGSGVRPESLGNIRDGFPGVPALERCYRAYVRYFGRSQENRSQ